MFPRSSLRSSSSRNSPHSRTTLQFGMSAPPGATDDTDLTNLIASLQPSPQVRIQPPTGRTSTSAGSVVPDMEPYFQTAPPSTHEKSNRILAKIPVPDSMRQVFDAKREMLFFKSLMRQLCDIMTKKVKNPFFNPYSYSAYQMSKIFVHPLQVEAYKIALKVTNNDGIEQLTQVGLNFGKFPRFNPSTTDSLQFLVEIKQVAVLLECFVNDKVKEQQDLLQNLNSLPTMSATEQDIYDNCAICCEDFSEGERLIRTSCNHRFHAFCILSWLVRNPTCPVDRSAVFDTSQPK